MSQWPLIPSLALRFSQSPRPGEAPLLGFITPHSDHDRNFLTSLTLISSLSGAPTRDLPISFRTTNCTNWLLSCLLQRFSNCLPRSHKGLQSSCGSLPQDPHSFVLRHLHILFDISFFPLNKFFGVSKFENHGITQGEGHTLEHIMQGLLQPLFLLHSLRE